MKLYIGTSGWQHEEFKDNFYSKDLKTKDWLEFYMENFSTVEINTSFYRLKLAPTYKKWREAAPKNFLFAAKLFRYLTHIKRLIIDEESLPLLRDDLKNLAALGDRLGPILIQLPPGSKFKPERLEIFLKTLTEEAKKIFPQPALFAIEFRHPSWLVADTYALLKKYRIAFCISDSPAWPTEKILTTDWAYVRFHGKPILFESPYETRDLSIWAKDLLKLKPKQMFVYFNNSTGNPAKNAKSLMEIYKKIN